MINWIVAYFLIGFVWSWFFALPSVDVYKKKIRKTRGDVQFMVYLYIVLSFLFWPFFVLCSLLAVINRIVKFIKKDEG